MFTISIDPLLFVGPFIIRWSLLIVVIAVGIGIWLAAREAEQKGIGKDNVYEVAGWIVIAGIVGARLFYVIDLWSFEFALNPAWSLNIFHDWGFDISGAVLGGLIATVLVCWKRGWRLPVFLDAAAPGLVLALAIGRIYCILTGDAIGRPTYGPLGFAYTDSNSLAHQLNVYYTPMPAFELIANLFIFGTLWRLRNRKWPDGTLFLIYLILYGVERYFLGFISAYRIVAFGLTQSQIIALAGLTFAIPVLAFRSVMFRKQTI
jgi:Prolipoprotein diacylglyceryltransferase